MFVQRLMDFYQRGIRYTYKYNLIRFLWHQMYPFSPPKKWVFVVGCYNSGTTLLERLLSQHPNVSGLPQEGVRYTTQLPRPEEYGWTRMWSECDEKIAFPPDVEPEKASRIKQDWAPFFDKKCEVFIEKSIANVPRMEWLDKNFNQSYFVGIIRNPYAVAESIRRKARPRHPVNLIYGDKYPIELTARQWLVANRVLLDNADKIKRFILIRYEDLVVKPIETLNSIFKFIAEPSPPMSFDGQILRINDYAEPILTTTDKRNITSLTVEEINKINNVIGETIHHFNYGLCYSTR